MLFTWDTTNLCIVFRWWHIRTTPGLIFSLLAVVALTAAYEALRSLSRRYESFAARKEEQTPSKHSLHKYSLRREIQYLSFGAWFFLYIIETWTSR
jgi:hypothetical protein